MKVVSVLPCQGSLTNYSLNETVEATQPTESKDKGSAIGPVNEGVIESEAARDLRFILLFSLTAVF